jgi:putative endonuclease
MYYLYILKCKDETLYTGITVDLERRAKEHNFSKLGSKYTAVRRPVKLVYAKKFRNRSVASKEEYRIKQLSKKEKLKLILCQPSLAVKKAGGKKLPPQLVKRQIRTRSLLQANSQ